jgi:hypothetical protein
MFKRLFRRTAGEARGPASAYELVPHSDAEAGRGFVLRRVSDGRLMPWRELDGSDDLTAFPVAGVSHREEALADPAFTPGSMLRLIPEPENPHDPKAVAVWDAEERLQVGYVPREQAPALFRELRSGERLLCLSMWEVMEDDRRVALRALAIGDSVSVRSAR